MDRGARSRPLARLVIAIAVAAGGLVSLVGAPAATAAGLPRWTGGVNLYRAGVFTTQQTWLWCTAADVQIIRNIADHRRDHSRAGQQRYFDYMRRHNRYAIPVSDGVDPAGWTAGLRHYVDPRYRLVSSGSFKAALRSAVRNLRLSGLPVGITVSHGNHAWVLTGFTATADPAVTSHFTVTSVRVVGPLWGLQSRSYGYDMRPDTRLTRGQLRGFFTPWHYAGVRMAWEGDWVSVQPQATASDRARAATPTPIARTTQSPDASTAASADSAATDLATIAAPGNGTSPEATTGVPTPAASLDPGALAVAAGASGTPAPSTRPRPPPSDARDPQAPDFDAEMALLVSVIVIVGSVGFWAGRRRGRTHPG